MVGKKQLLSKQSWRWYHKLANWCYRVLCVSLQSIMMSPRRFISVALGSDLRWLSSHQHPLRLQNACMLGTEVVPYPLLCAECYHSSATFKAGHNRWSKIGRKKAIVDLKRSSAIQRYRNQIVTAIRSGKSSDADANVRLASVIDRAKSARISKASIEGAIAHATSKQAGGEVIMYEGRADDGYMLLIEVMTDNKNRTRPMLKKCLKDNGWVCRFVCAVCYQGLID